MDPAFPPELEQKIFEAAALAHPGMIPTFLRVAQRVRIWIEPFLYRVIWFDSEERVAAQTTALRSKPPSFFKEVRHLFFDGTNTRWREEGLSLLRLCTNVDNLVVTGFFCIFLNWSVAADSSSFLTKSLIAITTAVK
ncbi:hypothetical protein C8J57DRAFT_1531192 [Mycena rebaudengoi]|nr:hypothetical protein C8J57DRAFT_1531192 [Mycena rebaudengoi]